MNDRNLGKLKKVDPREVWANEAADFTPWLAENLQLLNQSLGLDIELTGTEISVGNFAVDIAGRETSTGHHVIIENQLEQTDHMHLGQLLTYAAGLDATIIIWISPRVRDEHRQAVDWLNRQTPETVSFFAVELELLKIDDSVPAPRFSIVAEPSEFQRQVASEALTKRSPKQLAYHDFFSSLITRIKQLRPGFTNVEKVGYENWIGFGSGTGFIGINVTLARGAELRVELYITTGDVDKNRWSLGQLQTHDTELEAEIGASLVWEQLPKDCRAYVAYQEPVDPLDPADGALDWAANNVIRFRDVFGPRLQALRFEQESTKTDEEVTP
jgi:hypothetical protein